MNAGRNCSGGRGGNGGQGNTSRRSSSYDRSGHCRSDDDRKPAYRPKDNYRNVRDPCIPAESHHQEYEDDAFKYGNDGHVNDHGKNHVNGGEYGNDHGNTYGDNERHDNGQEEYAENFHQTSKKLEESEDDKSIVKFNGLHYKKATLTNQGCKFNNKHLPKFSGERVVMRSRPAEDYISPFKNKGNNFDDGSGRTEPTGVGVFTPSQGKIRVLK